MINPLEAMMAARAANQGNSYSSGVQNTGSVDPRVLLAMQQMNTPSIGQRMDGRNSEMVAVDPYKYADLKQQRDYQAAMNARTNNTNMQVANAGALNNKYLADQAYDRGKDLADTKYQRDQDLANTKYERDRQLVLDAEERENQRYQRRLKEQQEAERMKLQLNNEQFDSLRAPAMQAIQNKTYWNSGGEQETANKIYKNELSKRALQVGDETIQSAYKEEFKRENGSYPTAQLLRTDENGNVNSKYQEIANRILMGGGEFTKVDQEIQREVAGQVRNIGQSIDQQFIAVSQTMTKFGYAPSEIGSYSPSFGPNALTAPSLTGLPVPPANMGANLGTSDLDLDTSTPQGQETAAEIGPLKQVYDSLMMQVGGIGAKNEAGIAYNENPLTTGLRNAGDYAMNPNFIDTKIIDALKYAGVEDANSFALELDEMPGLDSWSSPSEKNAQIKAELERRIALLQEALGNSQNSE